MRLRVTVTDGSGQAHIGQVAGRGVLVMLAGALIGLACGRAQVEEGPMLAAAGAMPVGSSTVPPLPGEPGPSGAKLVPESCNELVHYTLGCESCPPQPRTCECFDKYFTVEPLEACTFGRCLSPLDCAAICAKEGPGMDVGAGVLWDLEFLDYLQSLRGCTYTHLCRSDVECGNGLCVGEQQQIREPYCSEGNLGAGCEDGADCKSGICVMSGGGSPGCESGALGATCNEDAHCPGLRCLVTGTAVPAEGFGGSQPAAPVNFGVCTGGGEGDPCLVTTDCTGEQHCVPEHGGGEGGGMAGASSALGRCSPGNLGSSCWNPSDCRSGICFRHLVDGLPGTCVSGLPTNTCTGAADCSYCLGPEHCLNGLCSRQPCPSSVGRCVTGDRFSPCFTDAACASGVCALNDFSNEGLCTTGLAGEPCASASDCKSGQCLSPSNPDASECVNVANGSPCGGGNGVCRGGQCYLGTCE